MDFFVEYTDTFGGEANYCWAQREVINAPGDVKTSTLMRRAKKALGLSGLRGRVFEYGDLIEFRPYGMATVLFISPMG